MKKAWNKLKKVPLPVLCYAIMLIAVLLYSLFGLVADSVLRLNGSLAERELHLEDFELKDWQENPDGTLTSVTDDPWMLLADVNAPVRTLRYKAEYAAYPHEINLYYINSADEPYSKDKRVWPVLQDDGSYLFTLPRGKIHALRLDAASVLLTAKFESFVLNEQRSPLSYFNHGWGFAFTMAVLPAVVAAVLRWLLDMLRHYGKKDVKKQVK